MMNMASDAWRMAMASHGLPESVPWHGRYLPWGWDGLSATHGRLTAWRKAIVGEMHRDESGARNRGPARSPASRALAWPLLIENHVPLRRARQSSC